MKFIPYGSQKVDYKDIFNVVKSLCSKFITQGPTTQEFENKISDYCNVKYSLAVNSATSALHLACLSMGIKKGDIVWTSPISFVASANCALMCGAIVDFVDISLNTFNISISELEEKLKKAKIEKQLPKAIVVVHFAGLSCNMRRISELSKKYKFEIIEDASHALGGKYEKNHIGSCKFSSFAIFSFHPVKNITTGEGGILTTNNKAYYRKSLSLRSHGVVKNSLNNRNSNFIINYHQYDIGFNYRITDFQAALGLSQLKKLNSFIKKRNTLAQRYLKELCQLPITFQEVDVKKLSAYHLFVIRIKSSETKITQKFLYEALLKKNIGVNLHYIPIYRQPIYKTLGYNFPPKKFKNSETYFKSAITIPLFPSMTRSQQTYIINSLKDIFKNESCINSR